LCAPAYALEQFALFELSDSALDLSTRYATPCGERRNTRERQLVFSPPRSDKLHEQQKLNGAEARIKELVRQQKIIRNLSEAPSGHRFTPFFGYVGHAVRPMCRPPSCLLPYDYTSPY